MATKQTNAKPLQKKRKYGKDSGKQWAYLTMLAPFTLAFTVFIVVPIISSIVLSFTNFNMVTMPSFVGFDNYWRIFTDDEVFMIALKNTLILAVSSSLLATVMGTAAAVGLNVYKNKFVKKCLFK